MAKSTKVRIATPAETAEDWGNFKPVSSAPRYRLIWRSAGPEKTGKDHFGLTAPGPIAIQSFDIGLEGVVEKFLVKPLGPKKIYSTTYEFDKNDTSVEAAEHQRDTFIADFEIALNVARTIIWDTETEVWELMRYAEFGGPSNAPKDYVTLNAKYRDLIQMAYDADVNLQLIQKVKEKWTSVESTDRNGKKVMKPFATGIMEPTGFKEAGYIVQANIMHSWDKERGFIIKVENCRQNMAVAGEEFENMDFPALAQLVFPDTDEENWS